MGKIVAIDFECSGLDHWHGTQPYFCTICDGTDTVFWQWNVDPLTRKVGVPQSDLVEIASILDDADRVLGQNLKYDAHAFKTVLPSFDWPWHKTYDTLIAGHLLASNQAHNLTDMAMHYLGVDIEPLEKRVHEETEKARRHCRTHYPDWQLAKQGRVDMPSAKEKCWKADMWLPRAVCIEEKDRDNLHPWWTVLRDYANADSQVTYALWMTMEQELHRQGLWAIYEACRPLSGILSGMERGGVTISLDRLEELQQEYGEESVTARNRCVNVARSMGYELKMPKSGNNQSLTEFVFGKDNLGLPVVEETEKGNPSLNEDAMTHYELSLEPSTKPYVFIKGLAAVRKRATALSYMEGYQRFAVPMGNDVRYAVIHGNFNQTGTATTRFSATNPNLQNICFDGETEVLTREGWVRADQLEDGATIAQYWKETRAIDFTPAKVHRPEYKGDMVHLSTTEGFDLLLTPNHRCLLRDRKTWETKDVLASAFKSDHHHLQAGYYTGGGESLSKDMITWLCAVQADGSYHRVGGCDCGIKFAFKKSRKIQRLHECLQDLGATYRHKVDAKGVTSFYLGTHQPLVKWARERMPDKKFGSWLLGYDRETLDGVIDELLFWDGDWTRKAGWSSSEKVNSDWVQILMALSGRKASISSYMPSSEWSKKTHHYVNVVYRDYSLTTNYREERIAWDGPVYCVTVPSSYLVVRRNGKVSITGNSKDEDFSLKYIFGPAPGREWWSMDYQNIELRIPAYESGEQDMIDLFERPNDPPYFGSNHLLIAHKAVFTKEFETCINDQGVLDGNVFKKQFPKLYRRTKNGNFAIQYQCGEAKADATYGVSGAYASIKARFGRMTALNDYWCKFAEENGYVETMPDKSVDPKRGYPIMTARSAWGRVKSTLPLSYHVQGTAGWAARKAIVRCDQQLAEWRAKGYDGRITLYVHDDLTFDLPKRADPKVDPKRSNLGRVRVLQKLMQMSGEDLGLPLPVSVDYHPETWVKGYSF